MPAARIHTFSGPTISPTEIRRFIPAALTHPPIGHGDIIRLSPTHGDVLAIIDGFFYQRPPIRHQELLDVLDEGVTVIGCSSMGALRAAELDTFGMIGHGVVYRLFKLGVIEADDEVTVAHLPEEHGFSPTTEALVNIRATVTLAVRRGIIDAQIGKALVDRARTMPFYDRDYRYIWDGLEVDSLLAPVRAQFFALLPSVRRDLKVSDARSLLSQLRSSTPVSSTKAQPIPEPRLTSVYLELWRQQERRHTTVTTTAITDDEALAYAQATAEDYPSFHRACALRLSIAILSNWRPRPDHWRPTSDDVGWATETLQRASVSQFDPTALGFTPRELFDLAECHASADAVDEIQNGPTDRERTVGNLARQQGWFEATYGARGEKDQLKHWLTPQEMEELDRDRRIGRVVTRALHVWPGLVPRPRYISELKLAGAYLHAARGAARVIEFNAAARQRDGDRYTLSHISHKKVARWFLARWGGLAFPHVALCDRGFSSGENFLERVIPIYPYARSNAGDPAWTVVQSSGGG